MAQPAVGSAGRSPRSTHAKPFYKSLYVQVLAAIAVGILLGHFYPRLGEDMKPLGGNDPYEQAKIVFGYIKALMEAAGGKMNDIVKITVFLSDMRHQPAVWKARREFFTGAFPCSTLVAVAALFLPQLLVEIEAVGFIGAGED